ncbi:MAG: hypothetical protein KDA44_20270 [Planctomycetales bacterium]|nr:hypothetical protein [Planctomycetales bacterium]
MTTFAEIAAAADQLSPDEQRLLLDLMQRRLAEAARAELANDVAAARAEHAAGATQVTSVDELMDELHDAS